MERHFKYCVHNAPKPNSVKSVLFGPQSLCEFKTYTANIYISITTDMRKLSRLQLNVVNQTYYNFYKSKIRCRTYNWSASGTGTGLKVVGITTEILASKNNSGFAIISLLKR